MTTKTKAGALARAHICQNRADIDGIRTKASAKIELSGVEDHELEDQEKPSMKIVGCDFHPRWEQIAVFDVETGEMSEHRLMHSDGEAERFYRGLPAPALVGIEACGNSQWLIDLLEGLGHEVWVGDAAQIRASYVRKQKTDRRDAGHILRLLVEGRFPRLWVATAEQRDQRQLLLHRHRLVEIRTRVKNGLQHLALNRGMQKGSRLWTVRGRADFEKLPLAGWTGRRREDLLELLASLDRQVGELDEAVGRAAEEHPQARLLMTQPGVGPITSLAFVLTIGEVSRFRHSNQVASYVGLIPREHSSGGRQKLGAITKQGNRFLRQLLVESAQSVTRLDEGFRREYRARCHHKATGVAKVAAARKLAVRLYWMLRQNVGYPEIAHIESSSRVPLTGSKPGRDIE
jgi:transposase